MPRPARVVPLASSVGEFPRVADALFDRLTLTCRLQFGSAPGGVSRLRSRLIDGGVMLARPNSNSNVELALACPNSGVPISISGRLLLADGPGGAVVSAGASRLDLNPLRLLRAQLADPCGPGLDGGTNVVGPPEYDRPNLLGLQLATVSVLVDAFLDRCAAASGGPVSAKLYVRVAELNRDLELPGAPAVARQLVREPNPWHRLGWARHYAGAPDSSFDGNYATVTWRNDRSDAPIRMKFYAKREDLFRVEVCYDNARAVALGVGLGLGHRLWPAGAADGSAAMVQRLEMLARAAVPLLDAMRDHVARLGEPKLGLLDLLVALAPLLRSGALPPRRRPGARPSQQTRAEVRTVLLHLLDAGRFTASHLRTNSTVRKALDRIVDEGALMREAMGRTPIYALPPRFSGARDAALRALWSDLGTDEASAPRRLAGVSPAVPSSAAPREEAVEGSG